MICIYSLAEIDWTYSQWGFEGASMDVRRVEHGHVTLPGSLFLFTASTIGRRSFFKRHFAASPPSINDDTRAYSFTGHNSFKPASHAGLLLSCGGLDHRQSCAPSSFYHLDTTCTTTDPAGEHTRLSIIQFSSSHRYCMSQHMSSFSVEFLSNVRVVAAEE